MKHYLLVLILLLISPVIWGEAKLKEIRYQELVEYGLFHDHGNPGAIWWKPFKANTVFEWPGEIRQMTESDKEYIIDILDDEDFASIFNHYVQFTEKVETEGLEENVDRYIRLYLQDPLMEYILEELEAGDYIDTYYWLIPPFSSFKQQVNCFMVWYGEVE